MIVRISLTSILYIQARQLKQDRNDYGDEIRCMDTLKAASGALITSLAKGGIAISNEKPMEVISAILKSLQKGKV